MKDVLGTVFALLFFCFGAAAAPKHNDAKTVVAVGLVCDTARQVERYVTLFQDGASARTAMDTVNTEHNDPRACEMVVAAFLMGEQVSALSISGRNVQIVRITIIAKKTDKGWQRTPAIVQYTAVFPEAKDV